MPPGLRDEVLERDNRRCRFCGGNRNLNAHHIDYRSQGGLHEAWNLIMLCDDCHMTVHSNKRRFQPLLRGYIWLVYVEGKQWMVPRIEAYVASLDAT